MKSSGCTGSVDAVRDSRLTGVVMQCSNVEMGSAREAQPWRKSDPSDLDASAPWLPGDAPYSRNINASVVRDAVAVLPACLLSSKSRWPRLFGSLSTLRQLQQ